MTKAFSQWDARIAAATDEGARRALLGEIGVWRAGHLMDIPSQRSAAWALARVYQALGEAAPAVHEARQLLSLCRTPPEATPEERDAALSLVGELEGRPPRRERAPAERAPREARRSGERAERERGERPPRAAGRAGEAGALPAGPDPIDAAIAEGRWADLRAATHGRRGPRAALLRVWAQLEEALALPPEAREPALRALAEGLRARLTGAGGAEEAPGEVSDGPLAALLGRPVPAQREPLVRALEEALAARPGDADALAAAALRDHVERHGARATAPWLFGLVARALAGESPETRAAIRELAAGGAFAVTAYEEAPFAVLVEAWRAAAAVGAVYVALRRGVLPRGEPDDRRLWTLRVALDGRERLLVVGPDAEAPYDDALAVSLARRITELADRVVVLAPGSGNAGFRAAAGVLGIRTLDHASAEQLVAVVREVAPLRAEAPRRERAAPAAAPAGEAPPRAPRERGPNPFEALATLFGGDEPITEEALAGPLGAIRRSFKAFGAIRDVLPRFGPAELDARLAPFLRAVHALTPAQVRLSEGASLALRVAAAVPGGAVEALLVGDDGAASRYGGEGIGGLIGIVRAVGEAGWQVDRVLRGVTRRERDQSPALDALGDATGGLWRIVLRRGDVAGELWWLSGLSIEASAAVPQLLLQPRTRAVVVAPGQGIEAQLGGLADAIPWEGAAAERLQAALEAWQPGGDEGAGEGAEEAP